MTEKPSIAPTPKPRPSEAPPSGIFDTLLRSGKSVTHGAMMIPIYLIGSILVGCAIAPGVGVFHLITGLAENASSVWQTFAAGVGIAAGFFAFGFSLMIVIPIVNLPVRHFVKPCRGSYHSAKFFPWYLHNTLAYAVRYSFLDFCTPTPFNHLYFKAMGMKLGKNAQVNTSNISDPALITIEDNVTIGGSVTIIGHYGQAGFLVLAPTIIRKGATVGILSTIMADVEIGEGAKVIGHSIVLPKTRIPAGETWGGVPAKRIIL